LSFVQGANASAFDRADVHEDVRSAALANLPRKQAIREGVLAAPKETPLRKGAAVLRAKA
jgi:hypothetical protein